MLLYMGSESIEFKLTYFFGNIHIKDYDITPSLSMVDFQMNQIVKLINVYFFKNLVEGKKIEIFQN